MTRRKLKSLGQEVRHRFRARFVKLTDKPGYKRGAVAIIFSNVKVWPDADRVAARLSFTWTIRFQRLGKLAPGQWIEFEARVARVESGYDGPDLLLRIENPRKVEWRLRHPSKVRLVSQQEMVRWVVVGEQRSVSCVRREAEEV